MTYAAWRKRTKLFDKYIYHGYHAMVSLIAQAAYNAGERNGLKRAADTIDKMAVAIELCEMALREWDNPILAEDAMRAIEDIGDKK